MNVLKPALSVLLATSLIGCAGLGAKAQNERGVDRILSKASFYLQCDKAEIKLQCINQDLNNEEVCSEYGIVGCGNKAIYTNIGKTWIMTASKSL